MQSLDSFEFSARRTRSMYNYDVLLNGKIWQLQQGTDYDCKTASMMFLLRKEAKARNLDLRIAKVIDEDGYETVVLQAILD